MRFLTLAAVLTLLASPARSTDLPTLLPDHGFEPLEHKHSSRHVSKSFRKELLARASVWHEPEVDQGDSRKAPHVKSAPIGEEVACNDDGGPRNRSSLLDLILDVGTYYYVVDGFNSNNEGTYLFDVSISLP